MSTPSLEKMYSSEYRIKNVIPESFWSDLVPNSPFDIDWNYWAAESIDLKFAPAPTCDLKNCESQYDSNSRASTLNSLRAEERRHRGTVHELPEHISHDLRRHQPIGENALDGW